MPGIILAQSGTDPLHWIAPVKVKSDNIFLLWSQEVGTNFTMMSSQKDFRYALGNPGLNAYQRLTSTQVHQDPTDTVSGNQQMDVAAAYFTNSVFENVVAAWEGPNQTI